MEFDTSIIEFQKIRDAQLDNINAIKAMSGELGHFLTVDDNLALQILPEYESQAIQIREAIKQLRLENQNASAYMAYSLEVLKKYSIPISMGKDDLPHSANLENVIFEENRTLTSLINHLKEDFTNDKISAAELEKAKKKHEKAREDRIAQVRAAKSELQKFIDSITAGA